MEEREQDEVAQQSVIFQQASGTLRGAVKISQHHDHHHHHHHHVTYIVSTIADSVSLDIV